MTIQLIDSRNRQLGAMLSENQDPLISTIFPNLDQALPSEIKAALEIYVMNGKANPNQVNISVEVNNWIDRALANRLLQHMHVLIDAFFISCHKPTVLCQLALFEDNKFIAVNPLKREN